MRFSAVLLACASTVLAYTVTSPNESQGWTNQGAQSLTWTRVSSDQANFTVVLTNANKTLMASEQVLAALVVGSMGNTTLNPPSAGWPSPGGGYQINLVASATNLDSILAQSPPFTITLSTVVPTSSKTGTVASTRTSSVSGSVPTDTTTGSSSGAVSNLGVPLTLAALAALIPLALV